MFKSLMDTGTDPTDWDTDSDRFGDGLELMVGKDPLDSLSFPVAPEIVSFVADVEEIEEGETVTLFWGVLEADSVEITPGVGEVDKVSGSVTLTPPVGTVEFTLVASNAYQSVQERVRVEVLPTGSPVIHSFRALTPMVGRGGRVILEWGVGGIVEALSIEEGVGVVTGSRVVVAPSVGRDLVERMSLWKYLDDGSDRGDLWREREFDDSGWEAGPGPLGYGEDGLATVVDFGGDASSKHITTYFRKSFTVMGVDGVESLTLQLRRDDGAEVFLNGVEVARDGLSEGPVTYRTLAEVHAGDDGQQYHDFAVAPALLVEGRNVLAVGVHQASVTSADLQFDLALIAEPKGTNAVIYTLTAENGSGRVASQATVWVRSDVQELVSYHHEWRYDDVGAGPGPDWLEPGFNDRSWPIGVGVLGREFAGPAAPLIVAPLLLPEQSGRAVVYLRGYFNLTALPSSGMSLELTHLVDDGAVVYLNGHEVHRIAAVPGEEFATRIVGDTVFEGPFSVGLSRLVVGENVMAVELHQPYFSTSDVVWGGAIGSGAGGCSRADDQSRGGFGCGEVGLFGVWLGKLGECVGALECGGGAGCRLRGSRDGFRALLSASETALTGRLMRFRGGLMGNGIGVNGLDSGSGFGFKRGALI